MFFSNIISRAGNRGGYSLGEVVIATALFMTAVVGVGGMLLAGTAGVSRSAQANKAEKLAMQKIEEVKNLPFYTSWEESGQDTDIDDFYYDDSYTNAQQFAHPSEENPVAGDVGYRRTTAVQYVYAGATKLEYASMDPDWVPNNPSPPTTFDKPKGGPAGGPYEYLHGIMIEVRVYYMLNGVEKSVVQHGLAGDLITAGGQDNLNPILVVEKITPNVGYLGDSSVSCTITVTAPDLAVGDVVEVSLWRTGSSDDIIATNVVVVSNTTITCRFNLLTPLPDPDTYNLSVYWVTRGFEDDNLRGCFDILVNPPTANYVYTTGEAAGTAWGYQGQNARTIWISGTNLAACNVSLTKVGQSDVAGSGYAHNAAGTLAWANFNLTTAVTGDWNMEVSNEAGGDSLSNCFKQNPQVTISSINQGGGYFSWGYRDLTGSRMVQVNGTYLYGLNSAPGTSDITRAGLPDCDATGYVYAASGNGISSSDCTYARVNYDLSGTAAERPNNTKWKVFVRNGGNNVAELNGVWTGVSPDYAFQMNPPPQLTGFSGLGSVWTGTRSGNQITSIGVTGKYLQSGANVYVYKDNGDSTLTDVVLGNVNPVADGTSISSMTMNTNVNPMTNSFMIWGGGAQNDNTKIGGTYYVYYWGPDDQQVQAPGSFPVSHAQYTMTVSPKQAWGTVSGGGTYWQDQTVSLSASPSSGNIFRYWQYPVGTDYTSANPWTFEATANRTIQGRFRKYLYNGGQTVSWVRSTWLAEDDWGNAGPPNLWVRADDDNYWSEDPAYSTMVTNGTHSFAGATTLYIYWTMDDIEDSNGEATFIFDNEKNGSNGNYYGSRVHRTDEFGWRTDTINVSAFQGSYYVRMHVYVRGWWDNDKSQVYGNQVYLE